MNNYKKFFELFRQEKTLEMQLENTRKQMAQVFNQLTKEEQESMGNDLVSVGDAKNKGKSGKVQK